MEVITALANRCRQFSNSVIRFTTSGADICAFTYVFSETSPSIFSMCSVSWVSPSFFGCTTSGTTPASELGFAMRKLYLQVLPMKVSAAQPRPGCPAVLPSTQTQIVKVTQSHRRGTHGFGE